MRRWLAVLMAVAGLKIAGSLGAWLLASCPVVSGPASLPGWYYTLLLSAFAFTGYALVSGGRRDPRSIFLGAAFVIAGVITLQVEREEPEPRAVAVPAVPPES